MVLRVAHVVNSPGFGGVTRVAHALIDHCDPEIVKPYLFYLKPGTARTEACADTQVSSGHSKATAMVELVNWLARHEIHILHTHSFRPNIFARMASMVLRPSGLGIVAHYHNSYADKFTEETLALERRLAGASDALIAVSDAIGSEVHEITGRLPIVVPNGVDVDRISGGNRIAGRRSLGIVENEFAVGLLGRVCRQKGIDIFVDAACAIAERNNRATFRIVGDKEDQDIVDRMCSVICARGLNNRVQFVGHREDIADVYAGLDLLVVPSRWEGFGLAIVEAMSCGVPVVATTVGGIPEVAGGAARLVPPEDSAALANEIEIVMQSRRLRTPMGDAGIHQAQKFTWSVAARSIELIYKQVSNSK